MNRPLVFSPHVICHGFLGYPNLASIVTDYDNLCLVTGGRYQVLYPVENPPKVNLTVPYHAVEKRHKQLCSMLTKSCTFFLFLLRVKMSNFLGRTSLL